MTMYRIQADLLWYRVGSYRLIGNVLLGAMALALAAIRLGLIRRRRRRIATSRSADG